MGKISGTGGLEVWTLEKKGKAFLCNFQGVSTVHKATPLIGGHCGSPGRQYGVPAGVKASVMEFWRSGLVKNEKAFCWSSQGVATRRSH